MKSTKSSNKHDMVTKCMQEVRIRGQGQHKQENQYGGCIDVCGKKQIEQ